MMNDDYYNVSSVRMMRFLYSLGFEKESYINSYGKENWRFIKSKRLTTSLEFYYRIREENKQK